MTRYAKRKLKYSRNENFNLLPYVEWDPIRNPRWEQKRTEGYVIVTNLSRAKHVSHSIRITRIVFFHI
jgi:hypothetical protein